jgi:hypothetical protein
VHTQVNGIPPLGRNPPIAADLWCEGNNYCRQREEQAWESNDNPDHHSRHAKVSQQRKQDRSGRCHNQQRYGSHHNPARPWATPGPH